MSGSVPALFPALPEIILSLGAMLVLMLGVFRDEKASVRPVSYAVLALMALAAAAVFYVGTGPRETFGGAFVVNAFTAYMKVLILVASGAAILMAGGYLKEQATARFEYPVLALIATLGMLIMVSANDLITVYLAIELQSLPLYVLAAFTRDSQRSTEAGLKYFVLGALSSGMLLYGCSLVYGFTGTVNFDALSAVLQAEGGSIGLTFGLVFVLAGLVFKISGVPFHMWAPDVYEGSPTAVTAFFAAAPKVAAMALIIRVMFDAFEPIMLEWQQVLVFVSIASMILGAFAAIGQSSIKRLMAYSSIGHMGYALVGLCAGTAQGVQGVIIYLTIYAAMNLGVFACILSMKRDGRATEQIQDLAGISKHRPLFALLMAVLMFSLAGIPPLAGFMAKWYVFWAAIGAELHLLAIIGILSSVVAAFYYLRIVKIIYFDEPAEELDGSMSQELRLVLGLSSAIVVFYVVVPWMLADPAAIAAMSVVNAPEGIAALPVAN